MVAPATALWIGVSIGERAGGVGMWLVVGAALVFAWLAMRAPDRVGTLALALACLSAGVARGATHERALTERARFDPGDLRPLLVLARVAGHPWQVPEGRTAVLGILDAEDRRLAGVAIRVRLPPGPTVEWGDRVVALVQLDRPPGRRSPGGYDARAASRAQGVLAIGRAIAIRRHEPNAVSLERATFVRWRRAVEEIFRRRLSVAARELIVPLVVGDRGELGVDLGADLQASGLIHLIALSGLHVTWMAAIARGVAAIAGGGPRSRAIAGALCALVYLGIAGPLPSLARAAATEWVGTVARLRDRPLDPVQALAVSVAVLLALSPGWAHDLGFQLSCAATLGLTTIGATLAGGLARWRTIGAWPLRLLVPTVAAQLGAQPLLLARFHALPWTTLGANLLAVPVCEFALAAAWLGVAIELLLPGGGGTLFAACDALCAALRAIARGAAQAPLALLPTGHHPGTAWLAAAGAALLAAGLTRSPALGRTADLGRARGRAVFLGAVLTVIAIGFAVTSPSLRPPPGRWWLLVLDVGQGDALALGFHDGWWLVDAGPRTPRFDAGSSVVLPFLRWASVRRLQTVVVTHNHGDHAGGVPRVLAGLPAAPVTVRAGWRPPRLPPGAGLRFVTRGDTLRGDPPVVVRWPPAGSSIGDENSGSLVLEIGAGRGRALLAADVDSLIESGLEVAPGLAALKVAHHGAARSSAGAATARWQPRLAVVSCGRRNPFGHPDSGALARLIAAGAEVVRTDREGTVWVEIGPEGARRIDWRSGAPGAAPAPLRLRVATRSGPLAAAPAHW